MFKKALFILISVLVTLIFSACNNLFAENAHITVYCKDELGKIEKKIFGNNFLGYDPMTYEDWAKEYYGYSDYGAGIWDPKEKEPVKEVIDFAKSAGITMARFPGGCGAHRYNWKNAIGRNRKHFLFGIDEFLRAAQELGAEPIITISYFVGNEFDAADMVEYLNSVDDGNNPGGRIDWAEKRTENGHPKPYAVKYFEIGNEDWHGDHRKVKWVNPEDYARRYLKYYTAMKAVDPGVQIGVILCATNWDKKVLEIIKDKVDFGIIHIYPAPQVSMGKIEKMDPKDIFRITLASPVLEYEDIFQDTLKLLKEKSGKIVPLAITEYNAGFYQDKPVPYRHCLGSALLNAELLRIFMKPEHHIAMANYWQFSDSYWGMIYPQTDFMSHDYSQPINYIRRPNYFVYELYNRHFGNVLLKYEVESGAYDISVINKVEPLKEAVMEIRKIFEGQNGTGRSRSNLSVPYLSVNASKDSSTDKIYLVVINKNMDQGISATVVLKDFLPAQNLEAWILNAAAVDSTNENNFENVFISRENVAIEGSSFNFEFQPHSLTTIEVSKKTE